MTSLGLVLRAQAGDHRAADQLIRDHTGLAYTIARDFYLPGTDTDDVRQEALFGLLKAIRDFQPGQTVKFKTFAIVCIRRQLVTALIAATRDKHQALTDSIRETRVNGRTFPATDLIEDPHADLHEILERRDQFRRLLAAVGGLTETERAAVVGIADGRTYAQISARTGLRAKAIDNAAQRGRRKLRTAA